MGMALGCIGMSREDFERCTPFEFYKAWERWAEAKRDAERNEWERTRVLALFAIQPYAKAISKRMTFYRSLGMKSRKKSVRR